MSAVSGKNMVPDTADGKRWLERGVRLGYTARALLWGIIGITSLTLALGNGGETQGSDGALRTLAGQPFGSVLLWAVTIGLAAYALWRLIQAATVSEDDLGKNIGKRLYYGVRGVIYGLLAWSAFKLVTSAGGGGGGGGDAKQSMTATALGWPGGVFLVGAVGVGIICYGLWQWYRSATRSWEDDLNTGQMSSSMQTGVNAAGIIGYVARGVLFGVIGWYLLQGALTYDPDKAIGTDQALTSLAGQAYGPWVLGAVAIGLLGFALFSLAQAAYRQIDT
ncbi:MAG TPA: DUF1206 domain-containing protein [Nitriliruptoraceae bacterium]|nr:DUF1206 domain-containing protein [Nitriliruptoraceae bacterium]